MPAPPGRAPGLFPTGGLGAGGLAPIGGFGPGFGASAGGALAPPPFEAAGAGAAAGFFQGVAPPFPAAMPGKTETGLAFALAATEA